MEDISKIPGSAKQEELVRRYCEEADVLLSAAVDYRSAVRMGISLCERFEKECDSELVVFASRQFIEGLLETRWGKSARGARASVNHE